MTGIQKRLLCAILAAAIAFAVLPASLADDTSGTVTVAVTVEKLTVDGRYILEPTLVTLPQGATASQAVLQALRELYAGDPDAKNPPYDHNGTETSGFYLKGIWDGETMLSEMDHGFQSGWVCCVNNEFIEEAASSVVLPDACVMRWQYTISGFGADVGNSYNGSTAAAVADKDALIWEVAQIRAAGTEESFGGAYTNAMTVLRTLLAPQEDVDAALEALLAADPTAPAFGTVHYMVLSDEIGLMFLVDFPEGFDTKGCYVSFAYADGRASSMDISKAKAEGANSFWFTCPMNALELSDPIVPTLHYGDDHTLTGQACSALDYINAAREKYPDNTRLIDLLDSLQDYGHFLQQTNWSDGVSHTAIPSKKELGDEDIAVALAGVAELGILKTHVGEGEPIEDVKFSLTLNARTAVNVFIKPAEGQTVSPAAEDTAQINGEKYYGYRIGKIGPKNLGKMRTFIFTTGAGESAVKVCPMSYVKTILESETYASDVNIKNAVTAFYNYYKAARAY
ncbi:MAG: hypothetical protein IKE62_00920 [Oscillospiraceae bacterium]|nr:hypothetical protein [Oscillospiraceae bacterium]